MKARTICLLVAGCVAAAVIWEGITSHPTSAGDAAPAFAAKALDGRSIALADYRGHSAVLLNFFADH